MDDGVLILGGDADRELVKQFLGLHGPPAYVRRAQEVESTFTQLVDRCLRQRDEWLDLVRLRLATLYALAGDWEVLRPFLGGNGELERLRELHAELQPKLRAPIARTSSLRALRRALNELAESADRFNQRWLGYLARLNLAPINELREDYNRYYIVEKECALRSPRLARQGFEPLAPVTHDDLLGALPPLPVIRPRG